METDNQPLDSGLTVKGSQEELQITPTIKNYWREISFWALFFAIIGFISLGFMVVSSFWGENRADVATSLLSLLTSGVIVFFPYWFLFKFARQLRQSLETESTAGAEAGFVNLRYFYQFIGILSIVFIVMFILGFMTFLSVMQMNM